MFTVYKDLSYTKLKTKDICSVRSELLTKTSLYFWEMCGILLRLHALPVACPVAGCSRDDDDAKKLLEEASNSGR